MATKISSGDRFGRLTVIQRDGSSKDGQALYACLCDCGARKTVRAYALRGGGTQSCGCLQKERASAAAANNATHGGSRTYTYHKWQAMWQRAREDARYADRQVHPRWESYQAFLADMGECPIGLSLERVDNDRGYEPGNCCWADAKAQANNRGSSRRITYRGETKTVAQWRDVSGIPITTLHGRLKRNNWVAEDSTFVPYTPLSLTLGGRTQTLRQWGAETGLPDHVLRKRITEGWSLERTLTEPTNKNRSHKVDKQS